MLQGLLCVFQADIIICVESDKDAIGNVFLRSGLFQHHAAEVGEKCRAC